MKQIFCICFILFAIVNASPAATELVEVDPIEAITCFIKEGVALKPEFESLIKAIQEKDFAKIIEVGVDLFEKGKTIYSKCLSEKKFSYPPRIDTDINNFLGCLLRKISDVASRKIINSCMRKLTSDCYQNIIAKFGDFAKLCELTPQVVDFY